MSSSTTVKRFVVMDSSDYWYGGRWEVIEAAAPDGLVLLSEGEAEHRRYRGEVVVPVVYGTLADLAAQSGVGFFPAS